MSTKKRTGLGIAAAGVAALAIAGGTFATFSDTAPGSGAGVNAGTLNLVVGGEGETRQLTVNDIAPGYEGEGQTFTFRNTGSIDGDLSLSFAVDERENTCIEPERVDEGGSCGNDGELGERLYIKVTDPRGEVAPKTLVYKLGGQDNTLELGNLQKGDPHPVTFAFSVRDGVGNKIQSDSVTLDVTADLRQNETQADNATP